MRILVVEDDAVISGAVVGELRRARFAVDSATTIRSAMEKIRDEEYDLIILDRMLPEGDSASMISEIKSQHPAQPVLFLTAKSTADDIITGLDRGADDYLPKPFSMAVLLARVRALLRRRSMNQLPPLLKAGPLTIDTNTCEVRRNGNVIRLSPKEYALLEYLARNCGMAVDRLTILSHVWDDQADLFSNTVDVHIRYLRKKIDGKRKVSLIRTVKGKGYMLCG